MRKLTLLIATPALLTMLGGCPPPATETTEEAAPTAELVMNLPVTTASDEAKAHFLEGLEAADMGRPEDARAALEAAVHADSEFALAYLFRSFAATSREDFNQHLQLAVEKASGASETEQVMIESVQKADMNDLQGQLELTQKLVELQPESPRALLWNSFAQAAVGDHEAARGAAVKATEMSPHFVPAYAALGNSYLFNDPKDFAKVEQYMQKVAELAPEEQNSYDLLGDAYRAQNKLVEARDAYTKAAELDPDNGSPLQQRGHVNSFLGEYEQARADYSAAMALTDPQTAANYATWRALVSVHEGNPEAAVAEFEEMIAGFDESSLAAPATAKINCLNNVVAIATHSGMHDKAAAALEQERALRFERAAAAGGEDFRRNEEATIVYQEGLLAARQGDAATAIAKAEEFMQLVEANTSPEKNEPAHEVIGLAHLVQGDHQKAIEHYQQTNLDNVYARYHLGLAYEGAGEGEKAKEIFQEVAANNFNFVGYALIRKDAIEKAG